LDVAWSEENENIVASCSGDGSIKLWDLSSRQNPFRSIPAHSKEVSALDWNTNDTNLFLSSSWDDTVKLWSFADCTCVRSFQRHTYCVYSVKWCESPQSAGAARSVHEGMEEPQASLQEPTACKCVPVGFRRQLSYDLGHQECSTVPHIESTCKGDTVWRLVQVQ
jgi:peroxin-7